MACSIFVYYFYAIRSWRVCQAGMGFVCFSRGGPAPAPAGFASPPLSRIQLPGSFGDWFSIDLALSPPCVFTIPFKGALRLGGMISFRPQTATLQIIPFWLQLCKGASSEGWVSSGLPASTWQGGSGSDMPDPGRGSARPG